MVTMIASDDDDGRENGDVHGGSLGGYVTYQVFFPDEASTIATDHRPCAVCMPDRCRAWKVSHPRGRR